MAKNFLITSWGNPGNLNPLLTAARRLRARGHRVRFLGEPAHREETIDAGFDALVWQRPRPLTPPDPNSDDPAWEEIKTLVEQVMFGAAADYAADTLAALRMEPTDALLTNDFIAGAAVAAETLGIPYALLAPHISVRPLEGMPPCGSGFGENLTVESQAAAKEKLTALMNGCLGLFNATRAVYGLPPLAHIFDHYDRADRVLLGLSPAFDFPAARLPENLRYVGPLLDQPSWSQPWQAPWSGPAERPRVLVSLSTSFQNQAELLRRIVGVLGGMHLDAVVTVGPAMEKESLNALPNVTVLHSAPHDTVMKEVSLVITHGGHGTVTRTLLNGLPLLVIPMGRDQGDNAARVVARNAGLAVQDAATAAEIAQAVQRLITEPQFRVAARHLGQAMTQHVASPVLVTEMEAIASGQWRRAG
jgi:MGT family glycosyltransferase